MKYQAASLLVKAISADLLTPDDVYKGNKHSVVEDWKFPMIKKRLERAKLTVLE